MAHITSKLSEVNIRAAPVNKCANCGKQADQRCKGCAEGLDVNGDPSQVFYCGKDCQREHWHASHKVECKVAKDRKLLYRIGSLLQWVFFNLRISVWYPEILNVQRKPEAVDGNSPTLLVKLSEKSGPDITRLSEFPRKMFEGEDEKAVLAHGAGTWAVTTMSGIVGNLIEALRTLTAIHEVTIRRQSGRKVKFVPEELVEFEDLSRHSLFQITLVDGSMYAVDVCIDQFIQDMKGKRKCCVFPWDSYLESLSLTEGDLLDTCELHTFAETALSVTVDLTAEEVQAAQAGIVSKKHLSCIRQEVAVETLKVISEAFEATLQISPTQLVRLSDDAYDKQIEHFKYCNAVHMDNVFCEGSTGGLGAAIQEVIEDSLKKSETATEDTT